jgi:hypothetical protein
VLGFEFRRSGSMTDRDKKKEYRIPQSVALSENGLEDVSAGLGTADPTSSGKTDLERGLCLIGGSAQSDCGTGLQACMCRAGGSPDDDCITGRTR